MNKVNFLNKDNFPLYSEGLAKLQNAIFLTANFALLGGQRYILSGCTESVVNNVATVSDGLVVIDGEILELVGAAKRDKITIREVKTPLSAFGVDYPESYVTRYVEFSATGEYNWADFEKIPTNQDLNNKIKDITGDRAGTIKEWAGMIAKIPSDYMLCDGRELSTSDYRVLFDNIGTQFGGDGVNSFRLPDLRGRFIAGYSGDGDYGYIGQKGGANTVSLTGNQNGKHNHGFKGVRTDSNNWRGTGEPTGSYTVYDDDRLTNDSGAGDPHENRPAFMVIAKIIKVR